MFNQISLKQVKTKRGFFKIHLLNNFNYKQLGRSCAAADSTTDSQFDPELTLFSFTYTPCDWCNLQCVINDPHDTR